MKFTCIQEDISRALSIVSRVVSSKSVLPVTQNVLMSAGDSMLKVTATDLNTTITTWIGAQIEEEGDVTIPAKLLNDFVSALPAETVEIELTDKPIGIHIKCAGYESNISGVKAEDFPAVPTVDEGLGATIDASVLKQAVDRVAFAAANDDSRPVLTGVKVKIKDDAATFAAADGFRLSVFTCELTEAPEEDMEFLVRANALGEMGRLLNIDGDVEFMVTENTNHVLFRIGDVEVVSSLISGAFPNYSQLIPANHKTKAVISTDEFLRATKTASIFARQDSNIIRLQMGENDEGPGHMTLSSQATEVGDNTGEIEATVTGEDGKIAFNSKYLTDVLAVLDGEVRGGAVVSDHARRSQDPGGGRLRACRDADVCAVVAADAERNSDGAVGGRRVPDVLRRMPEQLLPQVAEKRGH